MERNERKRFLNAQERQAFVSACNEDENRHAAALFMLLLYTGARLGEALDAKLQDVDLNSGTWFLPMTKAGKSAHVHLSDAAVSMLRGVIGTRKSGFLFPGKDPAKAMTRPAKALARISARAGDSGNVSAEPSRMLEPSLVIRKGNWRSRWGRERNRVPHGDGRAIAPR